MSILMLFLYLTISGIPLINGDSAVKNDGAIIGVVTLPKTQAVQVPAAARYRRGVNVQAAPLNRKVLVWLVKPGEVIKPDSDILVLDQKNQSFQPSMLAVRQNEFVRIHNSDPIYHNVFSLSSTKRFDVGRRPQSEFLDVQFNHQGKIDVFCDIHSNMHAIIYVVDPATVAWQEAEAENEFQFQSLTAGEYVLHVFSNGHNLYSQNIILKTGEVLDLGTIALQ